MVALSVNKKIIPSYSWYFKLKVTIHESVWGINSNIKNIAIKRESESEWVVYNVLVTSLRWNLEIIMACNLAVQKSEIKIYHFEYILIVTSIDDGK